MEPDSLNVEYHVQRAPVVAVEAGDGRSVGLAELEGLDEAQEQPGRAGRGVKALQFARLGAAVADVEALAEQEFGGHADEIETSIHLFLQPALVHMDRAVPGLDKRGAPRGPGYRPGFLARDPDDPGFQPTGVNGDPTLATVEKGRQALALLTREWLKALRSFADTQR
jgi:creatinine amidohydrolase/Fe(II)-dependent formamide hydrolase-like protein